MTETWHFVLSDFKTRIFYYYYYFKFFKESAVGKLLQKILYPFHKTHKKKFNKFETNPLKDTRKKSVRVWKF